MRLEPVFFPKALNSPQGNPNGLCHGAACPVGGGAWRLGTVGRTIGGTEIKLAPDGEILVKGPHVFKGYLKDAAATREALGDDGFIRTGDVGVMDERGLFKIVDGGGLPTIPSEPGEVIFPIFKARSADYVVIGSVAPMANGYWDIRFRLLDVDKRTINMKVSDEELARRKAAWKKPEPKFGRGWGALHAMHITQADQGCDLDVLRDGPRVPEPEIH